MTGERGSALIIAVLVMAVLTLLGMSYLLIADTENKIAENEKLAAQALYFAEGVAREAKRWFDRPPYSAAGALNLSRPTTAVMERTKRVIDLDGPGPVAAVAADGSAALPYYKAGVDNDHDGNDDIFDKPYRGGDLRDMFVGTAPAPDGTGPDVRISRDAGGATAAFLDALSEKVMPDFPAGGAGIHARVTSISFYAPPYLDAGGGTWTRYGIATVSTSVQILRNPGADQQVLAERTVTAVLNEAPYAIVFGPLHSCDELGWSGSFKVHWGPATVSGGADMQAGAAAGMSLSIPRVLPASPRLDLLYTHLPTEDGLWNALSSHLEGKTIDDPWFRFFAGLDVVNWSSLPSPQVQSPNLWDQDGSNRFQNVPNVPCPEFRYGTWKSIARSGGSDVHYFAWNNDTGGFSADGVAPGVSLESLTDGKTGLFFFDTTDGLPPHDFDASNVAANLTPDINIADAGYGTRGLLYVNTRAWRVAGSPGRPATFTLPGEPFRDKNENGVRESTEEYLNLRYNTITALDDPLVIDSTDTYDPAAPAPPHVIWNAKGPQISHNAIVWGILYISGQLDAGGTPYYDGSVVTYAGTETGVKTAGTANFYWDPNIKDAWPPPDWDLPRVIVTRWQTDE